MTLCFQVVVVRLAVTQGDASVTSNNRVVGLDVGVLDGCINPHKISATQQDNSPEQGKMDKQ